MPNGNMPGNNGGYVPPMPNGNRHHLQVITAMFHQ
jgi:hypothetical protein